MRDDSKGPLLEAGKRILRYLAAGRQAGRHPNGGAVFIIDGKPERSTPYTVGVLFARGLITFDDTRRSYHLTAAGEQAAAELD